MSDFDKILNVFEETTSLDGYAVKKTLSKGELTHLEIVRDGFHYSFDTKTGELIGAGKYPKREWANRIKSMYI